MNESITIGQKVGFGVVIVFLLALSSAPFMTQDASQNSNTSNGNGDATDQRVVSVR